MKKQQNNYETLTLEFADKIVLLKIQEFDEIDTEELTQIQYHNIVGELLTCSTVLNRIGLLLAEADELLNHAKLDFDVFYAQKYEELLKELTIRYTNTKGRDVMEKPSSTEIEQLIIRTPEYKVKRLNIIRLHKQKEIVNSLYWAIKSKDDKLNRLTDKLRPDDFLNDLLEDEINKVKIKVLKKAIK